MIGFGIQPSFVLPGGIRYRADFIVCDKTGLIWVEDVKGVETAWAQACRQKWRALNIVVKAKLEAVESGIAMFEEFLAYIVLPNGLTVKDVVVPEIKKAYEIKEYTPNFLLLEG